MKSFLPQKSVNKDGDTVADIKWIKLYIDMFSHKKIKFIRKLPEGNDILLCWIMLLSSAGKCNSDGYIYLTEDIPYTPEMLSDEFELPLNTVKLALDTFQRLKMVDVDTKGIYITGWQEYQNIDGMERIRQQNRERFKRHYDKKKQQKLLEAPNVIPNVSITDSNATDIDIDIEKEYIYCRVVEFLNEKVGTNYKATSQKTRQLIKARQNEGFTFEDFQIVIEKKVADWKGTDYEKFLRPETLFSNKFESYLNQKAKKAHDDWRNFDA